MDSSIDVASHLLQIEAGIEHLTESRSARFLYRCPPCRQFTPLLKQAYEAIKAAGNSFEIVFVSSDRSEQDMQVCLAFPQ